MSSQGKCSYTLREQLQKLISWQIYHSISINKCLLKIPVVDYDESRIEQSADYKQRPLSSRELVSGWPEGKDTREEYNCIRD